jgi:hypothetical protein
MGAFDFIASHTVTGATENVITFTSIPQTYQDLYFVGSILTDPGNTNAFCPIYFDNASGGWVTNIYGSTTRISIPPSGSISTSGVADEWKSRYVNGYSATETGPCYFEWTLHNYTTSTSFIAGFNQIGWSSFNGSYQEQYMGGHSILDSYTGVGGGPILGLNLAFGATYLAVGTKISLYGIGS